MIVRLSGRLTIALVSVLTLAVSASSHAAESLEGVRSGAKSQAIISLTPASYLHTRGKDIVDRTGRVVRLRGVNIGGWLVTEGWMCGQRDTSSSVDIERGALEQLEKRFGPEKAATLMNAWYDHWLTTNDLDLIQSWGFNVIRVPFSYRNLQDAAGNWKQDALGNIDFSRMDWVAREAAKRGIYVIFDLHVWPRQLEKDNDGSTHRWHYGLPSRWSKPSVLRWRCCGARSPNISKAMPSSPPLMSSTNRKVRRGTLHNTPSPMRYGHKTRSA